MAKFAILWFLSLFFCACSYLNLQQAIDTSQNIQSSLSVPGTGVYAKGVQDTLALSGRRAADTLSQTGGFSNSARYYINMPQELQQITSTLRTLGLGGYIETLEQQMNDAAELASAEAKGVFLQAVSQMSVQDALGILRGGDNAATDYFRATTEGTLRDKYTPIVKKQLSRVGFYQEFSQFRELYQSVPIAKKPSLNLEQHVVNKSLAALFDRISIEEAQIRAAPLERGTEFLAKVFAAARSSR